MIYGGNMLDSIYDYEDNYLGEMPDDFPSDFDLEEQINNEQRIRLWLIMKQKTYTKQCLEFTQR